MTRARKSARCIQGVPSVHFNGWGMTNISVSEKNKSIQNRSLNLNGNSGGNMPHFLINSYAIFSRAIETATLHRTKAPLNCMPCSGTMLVMLGLGLLIFFRD